jgi:2-polyprenyl-6-methoxyphenol hydroxylase-like FAD-dependent oxidoreductase
MNTETPVLIVGGSLSGLSMALLLGRRASSMIRARHRDERARARCMSS